MDGAKISAFPFILRISSIPNVVFPDPGAATICTCLRVPKPLPDTFSMFL